MRVQSKQPNTVGILVGGGPAPGINGVIAAATIEAINEDRKVLGILDGFKWLARCDTKNTLPLSIRDVSRIHFQGGSILRTSRENPTKEKAKMDNVVAALKQLGVNWLVTIGGDDTAFAASQLVKSAANRIRVVHVPKTIDNDLPLLGSMPTFGYETARSMGAGIIRNLMEDARATSRWYFVVTMGRHAGHLALGIGKAAGATLVLIPEQFKQSKVRLADICDVIEGSMIKRHTMGHSDGVVVIAEGLATRLAPADLDELQARNLARLQYDEFGNPRLSEVNLAKALRDGMAGRFADHQIKHTIVGKTIGYELRCAPPVPFDCEYTRDLGYSAIRFLSSGGSGAMISLRGGKMVPRPFDKMLDANGRIRVRFVDTNSESYKVARKYMIRLDAEDFQKPAWVSKLAKTGGYSVSDFRTRFGRLGNAIL